VEVAVSLTIQNDDDYDLPLDGIIIPLR